MAREASVGRPGVDEHPAPPGPARSRSFVTYTAAAVVSEVAMTSSPTQTCSTRSGRSARDLRCLPHAGSLPAFHTISTHLVRNLHKGAFKLTKSERGLNIRYPAYDQMSISELLAAKQK